MQHPFFSEALARQHIQVLQNEAAMERVASETVGEVDAKKRTRVMLHTFGLACFGVGLLIGSFLMSEFGLLPVAIMAAGISILVSLLMFVKSYPSLRAYMLKAVPKHQL